MKLDAEKNQIIIFDAKAQNSSRSISADRKKTGVERQDPLVQGKKFPVVDKQKKTVTIYSTRQKIVETIAFPRSTLNCPIPPGCRR